MMRSVDPRELIREAVSMLEDAYAQIFDVPPSQLRALTTDGHLSIAGATDDLMCAETASVRSCAASSAIHLCMVSALALLRIVRLLLEPPLVLSPRERAQLWRDLAANTKVAGQSAYRAALLLVDPHSGDDPAPGLMSTPWDTQMLHSEKRRSRFHLHWSRLRAENIRASEFIEFLRPLADLDGIVVSHAYRDEDQDERMSSFSVGDAPTESIDRKDGSTESSADSDFGNPRVRP